MLDFEFDKFMDERTDVTCQEEQEVWLFGRKYPKRNDPAWLADFASVIWVSYRKDFSRMAPYPYTSDSGWGCMLRASQMLMANTLKVHLLGRDWRLAKRLDDRRRCGTYCALLLWFLDYPGERCLFSIHNMVQLGQQYDKFPGEWYGPSTAALVMRDLVSVLDERMDRKMAMLVTQGDVIYINEVETLCAPHEPVNDTTLSDSGPPDEAGSSAVPELAPSIARRAEVSDTAVSDERKAAQRKNSSQTTDTQFRTAHADGDKDDERRASVEQAQSPPVCPRFFDPLLNMPERIIEEPKQWSSSVVVVMPLRLGLNKLNTAYIPSLLHLLEIPQTMGILGGRPNHAIYFVGHEGNLLHGLDPHTTQPTPPLDSTFPSDDHLRSMKTDSPQTMDIHHIDPSIAVAFYCKDRADFQDLCGRLRDMSVEFSSTAPVTVAESAPRYDASNLSDLCLSLEDDANTSERSDEEDDYVLL